MNRRFLFVSRLTIFTVVGHIVMTCPFVSVFAEDRPRFREFKRFRAPEARQGVAVDGDAFYAITNRSIARYDKTTGKRLARWSSSKTHPLIHLNHGIVIKGKLYCAHSNSPGMPATSSLEIFDAKSLTHTGTHSFGIFEGSLTWIDRHDNAWWAVFAHYDTKSLKTGGRGTRWTSLVKFDDRWRRLQAWVFPELVLKKFQPNSCSGGGWGPDGLLYVSGHDAGELYVLQLPKSGSTLQHLRTVAAPITGQAFAFDRTKPGILYGIDRRRREVVASKLTTPPAAKPSRRNPD